jgi:hypothetical protein
LVRARGLVADRVPVFAQVARNRDRVVPAVGRLVGAALDLQCLHVVHVQRVVHRVLQRLTRSEPNVRAEPVHVDVRDVVPASEAACRGRWWGEEGGGLEGGGDSFTPHEPSSGGRVRRVLRAGGLPPDSPRAT